MSGLSTYPAVLDTYSIPAADQTLGGSTPTLRQVTQKLADGVTSIEGALGVNPQGSDGSVVVRLNRMETNAIVTTDPRLTNARTPTAHKTTHAIGGSDPLTTSDIGAETPAGSTAKVAAHVALANPHPQYPPVKGQATSPSWWYVLSTNPFPGAADGAADTDMMVVY